MSTIKLTTFTAFNKDSGNDNGLNILFGSRNPTKTSSGNYNLEVGSVPISPKLKAPENCLLMLYGLKDCSEELQRRRSQARGAGANFHFAEIEAEVGDIVPGIADEDSIKTCRFANVKRMSSYLQQDIMDSFVEYIKEAGEPVDAGMNRMELISLRPDLFSRLFTENKLFKKIEVLIVPIQEVGRIRQVAIVRPSFKYLKISQSLDDDVLVLPLKFGKRVTPQVLEAALS